MDENLYEEFLPSPPPAYSQADMLPSYEELDLNNLQEIPVNSQTAFNAPPSQSPPAVTTRQGQNIFQNPTPAASSSSTNNINQHPPAQITTC
ncbi:hypothetical protein DNTS_002022 [Danionella cerebrum]|uniref:Uncharacterized protein n=1 Tax=Danionella cerebrum TaxID=2873325 RepID=A0A553Q4P2_9TELE|nr:hypothetical protein DNTS_002022 [Danionella translucida]